VELLGESGRAVTGQVRQAGWSSGEYQQDCQYRPWISRIVTDGQDMSVAVNRHPSSGPPKPPAGGLVG
jgi:hypothetical protein